MNSRKLHFVSAIAVALLLASCIKDKETPTDNGFTSAIDNNQAENYFNDILKYVDQAAEDNGLRGAMDNCIQSITFDTSAVPYTLNIDFGPVNCIGDDGRSRRGAIAVSFTGPYRAQGTVITITPMGYHLNDHLIQGMKSVTNLGPDANGNTHFGIQVDGTITAPNGSWTSTHHAERIRTWTNGENTLTPWDDVYLISGNGNGVDRNGRNYTLEITTPLRVNIGCPWIVSGNVSITPQDLSTRYVDFGNGSCDPTGTVTVNGLTFTFG